MSDGKVTVTIEAEYKGKNVKVVVEQRGDEILVPVEMVPRAKRARRGRK